MNCTILPLMLIAALALGCDERGSSHRSPRKPNLAASAGSPAVLPTMPEAQLPTISKIETAKLVSAKGPLIRITGIRSDKPQPRDKALNDAIQMAQYEIMKSLQALDPPVLAKPSLSRIRSDYLRADSVREVQPTSTAKDELKAKDLGANRVYVEIDVELTEAQVQQLRAGERVSDGVRGAGLLFALIAAAYGFLRLDAWTKGYLTLWLGLGAAAIVAAALLFCVRSW